MKMMNTLKDDSVRLCRFFSTVCAYGGPLLSAICILSSAAQAGNLTWDTTPGDGATITDGNGTWSNGGGNWNNGSGDTTWNNTALDSAIIGKGGSGTVTLTGPVSATNVTFNSSYTLASSNGSQLLIKDGGNGYADLIVNNGATVTLNTGVITDGDYANFTWTVGSSGTLIVNTNAVGTGPKLLQGSAYTNGTVLITASNALGTAGHILDIQCNLHIRDTDVASRADWGAYLYGSLTSINSSGGTNFFYNKFCVGSVSLPSVKVESGSFCITGSDMGSYPNVYRGFKKTGPGTLIINVRTPLDGAGTGGGVAIDVAEGTLFQNGTAVSSQQTNSSIEVRSGAVFGGTGSWNAKLNAASGSTVAPGNGRVGTFTLSSSYGNAALNGKLLIDISAASADRLTVSGNLNISGATLDFNVISAPTAASYVIASYGSLTGSNFAEVLNLPQNYMLMYGYGGNNIALVRLINDATTFCWDSDTVTGSIQDGSGYWDESTANWWNGTSNQTWVNTTNSAALFGGRLGTGTVSMTTAINAKSLTFFSNYTLGSSGGQILTFGDDAGSSAMPDFAIYNGATVAVNVAMTRLGTGDNMDWNLGSGMAILNANSTGKLIKRLNSGTMRLANGTTNAMGNGNSNVDVMLGAALELDHANLSGLSRISLSGTFRSVGGSNMFSDLLAIIKTNATVDVLSGSLTVNNITGWNDPMSLANNRGFRKLGGGDLIVNGTLDLTGTVDNAINVDAGKLVINGNASVVTGQVNIAAGATVQIGNGGTSGVVGASRVFVNNGTLAFNRSDTLTQGTDFMGMLKDSGSILQAGSGTTVLTGANTYGGCTTITNGVVRLGADNVLPGTTAVVLSGGTLDLNGRTNTAGTLQVVGEAALALGDGSARLAFVGNTQSLGWTGTLCLTGKLSKAAPTALRFVGGLTANQLSRITLGNYMLRLGEDGYLLAFPPGTLIFLN